MHLRESPIFGLLVLLAVLTAGDVVGSSPPGPAFQLGRSRGAPSCERLTTHGRTELVEQNPHPLERALQFARIRFDYLQQNVRDFTCLLVKREQLEGRLRSYEFIRTKVRLQQVRDGRIVTPFSVYMHYLGPEQYQDRKVVYVEGQNDGKMIVRNGGKRFSLHHGSTHSEQRGGLTRKPLPDQRDEPGESRSPVDRQGRGGHAVRPGSQEHRGDFFSETPRWTGARARGSRSCTPSTARV